LLTQSLINLYTHDREVSPRLEKTHQEVARQGAAKERH
jgi:hypothetical protein